MRRKFGPWYPDCLYKRITCLSLKFKDPMKWLVDPVFFYVMMYFLLKQEVGEA